MKRSSFEQNRKESEDDFSSVRSSPSGGSRKDSLPEDISTYATQIEELAPFNACIEACDQLASTSCSSGRFDRSTGLVDCSVLVSADGDLLINPQEQQKKSDDSEAPDSSTLPTITTLQRTASELGEEYSSAIFVGDDLSIAGDKALNGFSAKGWSIPGASLALKQTNDNMGDLTEFVEDLVLTKKSCAAQENQMVNKLRPLVEGSEHEGHRVVQYERYVKDRFPDQNFEVLSSRVGPLSSAGGTIQATVVALDNYYSTMAEAESLRWKLLAEKSGPLSKLKKAKENADRRISNREVALQEMLRRVKAMEDDLIERKAEAARKWEDVSAAEEQVTKLIEGKMMERSRLREQQRLEQIKQEEEQRAKDAANGNLGATSSEIWDIVSAVAESMEGGSFEPMDLPQIPLAAPRDQSSAAQSEVDTNSEEGKHFVPIASRQDLEDECHLPDLRYAALAADEAIEDAANSLLTVLSHFDTTRRSARLAAETCLVDSCNSQASCIKAIIKAERQSINERLQLLSELEEIADGIDVRADINHYITLDKKEPGGRNNWLGDDDDGGVASALAVLNNHIDGNMGYGNFSGYRNTVSEDEDDSVTAEFLEEAVDKFFCDDPLLRADAADNAKTQMAQEELEINILRLCKIAKEKSSSGRSRRSNICYSLNAKRKIQTEIPSFIQFDGLCRVFTAILSGCDTKVSGVSLGKMLMTLSGQFYLLEQTEDGGEPKEIFIKSHLVSHPLWENERFWDEALYQTVTQSLTDSGVMANFEDSTSRFLSTIAMKKSEWSETKQMTWHDLKEEERQEAAIQVHAVVFAQICALANSMIEFGCGLQRSCAFARRMAVRNQLPISQRAALLQHLIGLHSDDYSDGSPVNRNAPSG